ncbi:MAG: ABC transporter transmembrane domain-containing protein [Faecalibacterium prausnitzii]
MRHLPAQDHEHHHQLGHGRGHHPDHRHRAQAGGQSTLCSRIIDGAAQYFMSGIGHIMGVHIETDMRRDAFDHLLRLDHTYYNNTKVGTIMGAHHQRPVRRDRVRPPLPRGIFHRGHQDRGVLHHPRAQASIPLTLVGVRLRAADGRRVRLSELASAPRRFRQQRIQIGELNATIEDSLLGQGVVKAVRRRGERARRSSAQGNKDF